MMSGKIITRRHKKLLALVLLGGLLMTGVFASPRVSALTNTFPDASNNPDGVNLRTEVAQQGNGIQLQARESDFEVFIPATSYVAGETVTITIVDACDSNNLNDFVDQSMSVALYETDGTTQIRNTLYNGYGGGHGNDCSGNNLVFNNVVAQGNFGSTAEYGPKYYYIEVKVKKVLGISGVKNFSVRATDTHNSAKVTYAASTGNVNQQKDQPTSDGFAWWNAAAGFNVGPKATIQFEFAPDCTYANGNDVWLKWYGADDGNASGDQPDAISFDLINLTTGATFHVGPNTTTWSNITGTYQTFRGLGAALQYNTIELPRGFIIKGDTYRWRWNQVDHLNGILIWMPFSDLDTNSNDCTPPPAYQCGNATVTPGLIQPNDPFTLSVDDTYTNGPPVDTAFHISVPAIGYLNNNATPLVTTGTDVSFTTPVLSLRAPPAAGTYPITYQLFDGATADGPVCPGDLIATNLPYFGVYGADVSAGGDFSTCVVAGCTATSGVIEGWYNGAAAAKAGASTLFAAIALGKVTGFASAQNAAGGPPGGAGNVLTFANPAVTGSSPSQVFGGQYAGTHTLFTPGPVPGGTPGIASPATIGGNVPLTGVRQYTGNLTLNGGLPITATVPPAASNNLAIYVKGNVYITSNITYGSIGGNWTINANGTSNIPSFVLIVTGNIYIAPAVTELDGIYIAEQNTATSHGGTIYTCGTNTFTPLPAVNLYGCNNQLTVYGSFIADQVNLMRTFGTLDDAQATESPDNGSLRTCTNGSPVKVRACGAEVFDFSPEMYLSNPAITQANNGGVTYDSIAGLPPVL